MLEPYDGKLSRTVLRREGGGNTADPADYSPLVNRLKGQVIKISPNSTQFINPMDINANYSEEDNPLSLKADFILSLCELVVGGKEGLLPVEKTVIDRCVHLIYRKYFADPCPENMPILDDRCHRTGNLCERLPEPVQPPHQRERQQPHRLLRHQGTGQADEETRYAHCAGSGLGACHGKPQQRKVHTVLYGRDAPASERGADCGVCAYEKQNHWYLPQLWCKCCGA